MMGDPLALYMGLLYDEGSGEIVTWSREAPADLSPDVAERVLSDQKDGRIPDQILRIENGLASPDVTAHYTRGKDYDQ